MSLTRMFAAMHSRRGAVRMTESRLPELFADLEPFAHWALATERERNRQRHNSTMAELQAFHGAMLPRVEAVIEYLNAWPLERLPEAAQQLHYMTLSLAEIAPAVDWFKQPSVPGGYDAARLVPLHH